MAPRERGDDWARQIPDWRERERPYRSYGWESGQSSLPEFRDPSVHLTDEEWQEVRQWRQHNQEMERRSDLFNEDRERRRNREAVQRYGRGRWEGREPEYRDFGWESGQSSLPEFRDPGTHLTDEEWQEVRDWRERNRQMERRSGMYDRDQERWGRAERRSGGRYDRGQKDLEAEKYRDYGWEAGQSSLPEFRDPSVHLTDEEWQEVRDWRERNRRMSERGWREQETRRQGSPRRGREGRLDRFAGRPGPGTRGYFGEPYAEEYSPQGYYSRAFGRGFDSQGNFSVYGNWTIPGPHMGSGPRNYQRLNEQIHEDVCERLTQHGQIDAREIEVRVDGDEVILSGYVPDRRMKRMAEDVAESIHGVRDVQNHLRIKRDESGMPGGGAGRIDRVGRSGVYPASGPMPEGDAEVETMAAWGQGERGAEGYEDHGESELRIGRETEQANRQRSEQTKSNQSRE